VTGGVFLVVEGPNGVGKTTATSLLARRLRAYGRAVHVTSEPSRSQLGRLIRASESTLSGRALALAVAADRYHHVDAEILPALKAGHVVISDRYVHSSLVLQRLDGLSLEEIWQYNAHVPPASLSFYLHHTPQTLRRRLGERPRLSRLERDGSPERELALYEEAFDFLRRRGWRQERIDCRGLDPDGVVAMLLHHVDRLMTV
jgi:dTMP kinase